MRCLFCGTDPIPISATLCPECNVHLPTLLRHVLPPGTTLQANKYRLDYALGQGGFGITYKGMHIGLEKAVAIKEFFPQDYAVRDPSSGHINVSMRDRPAYQEGVARFVQEGRVLARIEHPNVIRVQDHFEENGTAYLVMELIAGQTLRDQLALYEGRRLPNDAVVALTDQLVSALEASHKNGIYHLDIKPDNILITADKRVILIDFGAAQQGSARNTKQAFAIAYAAPEILDGGEIGPYSDLFELGMVLHEMLTGELPPCSLDRKMRNLWSPTGPTDSWQRALDHLLHLESTARPQQARLWWNLYKDGIEHETGIPGGTTPGPDSSIHLVPPITVAPGSPGALERAIDSAPAGTTIKLQPGTYLLQKPLYIANSLTLLGSGMRRTSLVYRGAECLLTSAVDSTLTLQDLAVDHMGAGHPAIIQAIQGTLDLRRCRLDGHSQNPLFPHPSHGLRLEGSVRATVSHCEILNNPGNGIELGDEAHAVLENNICTQNKRAGVAYRDQTTGTARQNTCHSNGQYGIAVAGQAQPTLDTNICRDNQGSGIAYADEATGTARENTCSTNAQYGMYVTGRAKPALESNTCAENQRSGIAWVGHAAGTSVRNTCRKNSMRGIYIGEDATPDLIGNICIENEDTGIAYFDRAAGTARENSCGKNLRFGIFVGDQARPTLQINSCTENHWSGLGYGGGAAGTATQNLCQHNHVHGILISDQGQPTLEANTCETNQRSGILYRGDSAGVARMNQCGENANHGISVGDYAWPTLDGNECSTNQWSGLAYTGEATGIAHGNTCVQNLYHGISVAEQARPTLEENRCEDNQGEGIAYLGGAAGRAQGNILKNNRGDSR